MDDKISETFIRLQSFIVNECNGKIASGGKEIIKKCHICGDSKDPTSAHMYIGMKDGVILYNCFKCNSKGIVDGKFLRSIGCYDTDLLVACNKYTDSSNNRPTSNKMNFHRMLSIPRKIDRNKLSYISNRLGIVLSDSDIYKYRIITQFDEFMSINNINKFTRNIKVMEILNDYFVGFLSSDMSHIIFRRIVDSGIVPAFIDQRYVNYNIYGNDNGNNFYTIANSIRNDLPISVNVAEGVFDIISVERNFPKDNSIYAAVCGKSYMTFLSSLMMNYGISNYDLHFYIDSDMNINNIYNISSELLPFGVRSYIHINQYPGQKDFGVPNNLIRDSCRMI